MIQHRCPLCASRMRKPVSHEAARVDIRRIIDVVANEYMLSADAIIGESRGKKISEARSVVYWLGIELGWHPEKLATQMQRHRTTVLQCASHIETRVRTKPIFQAVVRRLVASLVEQRGAA